MHLALLASGVTKLVDKRGGPKTLKEDAEHVAGIARGEGTRSDKVKASADALKKPGAGSQKRSKRG